MSHSWIRCAALASLAILAAGPARGQALPDGPYATPVDLPACRSGDPEVRIIDEATDWAAVDDPTLRVFCVRPGDYAGVGPIRLRVGGSAERPRVLRFDDPASPTPPHPVRQARAQRAIVRSLDLRGADHWWIDGLTVQSPSGPGVLVADSDHVILNRMLVQDGSSNLVRIVGTSSHGLIQNSVVRRTRLAPQDRGCVTYENPGPGLRQQGNRLVQNEIYDCTDGVQLHLPSGATEGGHFPGLVIADNDIYLTPARYTDCRGTLDPDGPCGCAENGIDVKIGGLGSAPAEIVSIRANRIWGWRETDHGPRGDDVARCGGSGSWGDLLQVHTLGAHVEIRGNRLLDGPRGVWLGGAAHHVSVTGNHFHALDRGFSQNSFALGVGGDDNRVLGNVVVDSGRWLGVLEEAENTRVHCNVVVDSGPMGARLPPESTSFARNTFYGTERSVAVGPGDRVLPDGPAPPSPLCFWRRRWTGPEQVCIPHGIPTADELTAVCADDRSTRTAPAAPALLGF